MKPLAVLVSALLSITCGLAAVAPSAGAQQAQFAKKKCKKAGGHHHGKKRRCKEPPKKHSPAPPSAGPGGSTEAPAQTQPPAKKEGPLVLDADKDGVPDASDNCPTTANADQADDDADGIGDACDLCPADPDPDGYCPATVYNLNELAPAGTRLKLQELLVTARTSSGETAWVMVGEGDAAFSGTSYSGLELDLSHVSPAPAVGDRVFVKGTVRSPGRKLLEVDSVEVTSVGQPQTPVDVTSAELEVKPATLNGLLVKITGGYVQANSTSTWVVHDGATSNTFTVGNRLIGTLPSYPANTLLTSETGIADMLNSGYLLPRTSADVPES